MTFATLTQTRRRQPRLGFFARILAVAELRKQRRALSQLDGDLLKDIGLTRAEAAIEAARPVWDAPENWRF